MDINNLIRIAKLIYIKYGPAGHADGFNHLRPIKTDHPFSLIFKWLKWSAKIGERLSSGLPFPFGLMQPDQFVRRVQCH